MDAESFKSEIKNCDWLFDLFAIGYDFIATRVTPTDLDAKYPDLARTIGELAGTGLRDQLVAADGEVPPGLLPFLVATADWEHSPTTEFESERFLTRLLALLRLIDEVAAGVNYFNFGLSGREWPKVRSFLRAHHNLLSKSTARRVIVKPPPFDGAEWWQAAVAAGWMEPVERGQFHHRLFQNVVRLPEFLDHDLRHIVLRSADDAERNIGASLRVGVIPLIRNMEIKSSVAKLSPGSLRIVAYPPAEFGVEIESSGDPITDFTPLLAEVENALPRLCQMGAHIILLPELVVPDPVLERVKSLLLSISSHGDATPFLVVAGTFGRADADSGRVYNEAVILNGRGNELFRQRKMHAYTMHGYEQPKYGLNILFEGKPKTERMELMPRVLTVCDSPMLGWRVSVLICEDFCQQTPGIEAVRRLRSNLLLSPVMAGSLDQDSSFFQTSSQLVLDPECIVVVANSRALPSQQPCAKTDSCSLGIFGSPLYKPNAGRIHLLTAADPKGFLKFEIPC